VAITTNLFFAGLLSILLPEVHEAFNTRGTLGVFSVLNIVALVLVLFLIEETSSRSLEDLEMVYARPKSQLVMYVWKVQLPYFVQRWILWRAHVEEPVPYDSYGQESQVDGSESEIEHVVFNH
jgi:hypothetical protein